MIYRIPVLAGLNLHRPEIEKKSRCIVQMKDSQTILSSLANTDTRARSNRTTGEGTKTFAFDRSYWSFNRSDGHYTGQAGLFTDLGQPLLENAFKGYNNCIFAYGQTGSGKSYSMMGFGEESGIIPRICCSMFEQIERNQADKNLKYTVEVSYLEIYNERVRDLLNPATKGNLKVREHPSTGPYVEDLASLVVRSFKEIENLMDEGNKARTVAATNMNETSSRSHAVFTLTLTQRIHDVETSVDTEKVAKISLVDLAGSERANSTGATGARLKEGAEINRSLSTLGRVIAALADLSTGKKRNTSIIPYRDSVLTWLLKDSLGGNSLTAMIAAISPADINYEETLSTLRYADSAKRIKNHAVVNEDPNARMIRELKEELAQLRSKLISSDPTSPEVEGYRKPDAPLEQQFVSITQPDGELKQVSKADIVEQLGQSEKLYRDLNQTWEEKLVKTEKIQREREAALEELGISIEKNFVGLSTPKKMPHLVNLSDDPLLAECLVYNLKPGVTTLGNASSSLNIDIRLNGTRILDRHCTFTNYDDMVFLAPIESASVLVNGTKIEKQKRLRSGYRIIIGDFHIFRFNNPQEARAERAEQVYSDERRQSVIDGRPLSSLSIMSLADKVKSANNSTDTEERSNPNKTLSPTSPSTGNVGSSDGDAQENKPVAIAADNISPSPSLTSRAELQSTKDNNAVPKEGTSKAESQNSPNLELASTDPHAAESEKAQIEEKNDVLDGMKRETLSGRKQNPFNTKETKLILKVLNIWKQRKDVAMGEEIFKNVSLLKEAQILSQILHEDLHFQFTVVDSESLTLSSYDMVLNKISSNMDEELEIKAKPCVAVRVSNFRKLIINVWSLERLRRHVRLMRQIHQYTHNPEYLQHLRVENEISGPCLPTYSHIGDADVPLTAVFDLCVRDLNVEVTSPHTFAVIGMLKLSLEPSSVQGASQAFGFNVILHEMSGFTESEGTDVHAQIYMMGSTEDGGASSTQQISGFNEHPLQFGSVHSMRIATDQRRNTSLRVSVFARVSKVHIEKLISWDNIRDVETMSQSIDGSGSRLAESAYIAEEQHELFTRIQILEISENGDYSPSEVMYSGMVKDDVFHLRQGLQRRIKVKLVQNSARQWDWEGMTNLKMSKVRLLDLKGTVMQMENINSEVDLKILSTPATLRNSDGTCEAGFVCQWDSSAHGSPILDKVTLENYNVQATLSWQVLCENATRPSLFSVDLTFKIRSRFYLQHTSLFSQLWRPTKPKTSKTGIFVANVRPATLNRLSDLWRAKVDVYINGEEVLTDWMPRMASLVEDYLSNISRRQRILDLESVQSQVSRQAKESGFVKENAGETFDKRQEELLKRVLRLWKTESKEGSHILKGIVTPPEDAARSAEEANRLARGKVFVSVQFVQRNPITCKSGYVMMPDRSSTRWLKRFIELRIPYIHVFSVSSGEELNAINLTHSRIDHQPQIERILSLKESSIFAIYAPHNSYLFFARTEQEKIEWIISINQIYSRDL